MSVALADKTEVRIPAPELRGNNFALGANQDTEVCLDGPGGCVAGETRIYDTLTGKHIAIKELHEKKIAPMVQTLMGAMRAEVPFRKGIRDLYRVTLASGRQCVVTGNHRVLTPKGWRFVSDLSLGDPVGVGEPNAQSSYALHSMRTDASYQSCCLSDCHPYDVSLPHEKDTVLDVPPSLDDARRHTPSDLRMDDRVYGLSHIPLPCNHHASKDYSHRAEYRVFDQSSELLESGGHHYERHPHAGQSRSQKRLVLLDHERGQCYHNRRLSVTNLTQFPQLLEHSEPDLMKHQACQPFDECLMSADRSQEPVNVGPLLTAYIPSKSSPVLYNTTSVPYNNTSWDTVSSIEYVRTDEYFDLHVPVAEHYLAEGIWHHNTGKTFAALYKIHLLLTLYPGARALVARKTNTALAGSAMVTFREDILRPEEGVRYFGGNRIRPAAFQYPNGSELVVNGLDKAEKVKSTAFDIALINEATEVTIEDWEFVRSRLRHGKLPYHQLIADVNPVEPEHWLNVRMNEGITTRLLSTHEDNPRFFDTKTNAWTPEGYEYIFVTLAGLTGVLLERLRFGIWAAAHGTVYQETWNRAKNIIDRFPIPKDWSRWLGVDFGFTNPFVCKWYAMDSDGRLYVYRELYRTHRLVEDHAVDIALASGWYHLLPKDHEKYKERPAEWADPLPREVICDTDAEDRHTLEKHLGLFTTPAHKTVSDGIQAVAARLRPAGDGKPRLMYFRDCLVERDPELAKLKKPASSLEEFNVYIWDTRQGMKRGEQPVKEYDHGMDVDRYVVASFDLQSSGVSYFKDIWNR